MRSQPADPRGLDAVAGKLCALLCVVAVVFGLIHDAMRWSLPPDTHHDTLGHVIFNAKLLRGWEPLTPDCTDFAQCTTIFSRAEPVPPRSLSEELQARLHWITEQGPAYTNRHPLFALPAAILVNLFPGHPIAAAGGPLAWLVLLLASTYSIGRTLHGPTAGLLAAIIAAGTPGIFGHATFHTDPIAITAIASAMAAVLLRSRGLADLRKCALVCLLGLAAIWVAENRSGALIVVLTVVAPGLAAVEDGLEGPDARSTTRLRWWLGAFLVAIPVLTLAGLCLRDEHTMYYLTKGLTDTDPVDLWFPTHSISPNSQLSNTEDLFRNQLTFPLAGIVGAGVVVALMREPRRCWPAFLMFFVPFVALSLNERKAGWYGIPTLPGLVVVAAIGLVGIERAWLMRLATISVAVTALATRIAGTWGPGSIVEWAFPQARASGAGLTTMLAPAAVFQEFRPEPAKLESPLGARAQMDLLAAARALPEKSPRIVVFAPYHRRSLATCWVLELSMPELTCFGPNVGHFSEVPPEILAGTSLSMMAWLADDGLKPFPTNLDALPDDHPLSPQALQSFYGGEKAEAFFRQLLSLEWSPQPVPTGVIYTRAPTAAP